MSDDKLKECTECSQLTLQRLIGTGTLVFRGEWGDKTRRREREDRDLFNKAKVARRKKNDGSIPRDAHVNPKDIDIDKYHGPKKLPKGHPERGGAGTTVREQGLE